MAQCTANRFVRVAASCSLIIAAMAGNASEFSAEEWRTRIDAEQDIDRLAAAYVEYLTHDDPVYASQIGIHGTAEDPYFFDRRLPDHSADTWVDRYSTHLFLRERLAAIDPETLPEEDRIDHHILRTRVELQIVSLTRLDEPLDPLGYVTQLGSAFNVLIMRDYAPAPERLRSFGARCAAAPRFLDQARQALVAPYNQPSAVRKETVASRLANMYGENSLFERTLPKLLSAAALKPAEADRIRGSCRDAAAAIERFEAWFVADILPRPDGPWRAGPETYAAQYLYQMDYPLEPDELLTKAERALDRAYAEVIELARSIHDGYLAEDIEGGAIRSAAELADREIAQNVFDRMSADHSTVDSLIEDSYAMADAIVGFVEENRLLDLPPTAKLRIEEIPPHLSGYAVAQIHTAPPFEPQSESVWYWDLDFLSRAPGFLQEYSRPVLALVYIHEGVPGHFVQLEYSNRSERIAPRVFRNGPMVEGWASYIETQLVEEGFTVYPDRPFGDELQQLAGKKLHIRAILNAIIDIRLQTTDWPGEEAVRLMIERGFQQEAEARGKLTRAQLGAVQLATYFAGYHAIEEILGEYRAVKGDEFSWQDFNERLIGAGSPPFFALRDYMLEAD
ncbi:MAG: DUF885 domain-containing protein [Gammaproteobacteria bacterium]|nr:DUF885 domain-containing protein [Gammaproteobacteria bacterium]